MLNFQKFSQIEPLESIETIQHLSIFKGKINNTICSEFCHIFRKKMAKN